MLLVHLLAFAGDLCGGYLLLRLTRRWWLLVPGALFIGILSGALSALVVHAGAAMVSSVSPYKAFAAVVQAAELHALLTIPCIFWLRWWMTPMK